MMLGKVSLQRMVRPDRVVRMERPTGPDLTGLYPYQREGVLWLRSRERALLGDEMGLGKTVQVLRALERRARTIVVCPASVAIVWEEETPKWRPDLVATTGEHLRRPREGEVLIISYDSLPDPAPNTSRLVLDTLGDVTLVGDEIHMVKSYEAQRTQKFRRLGAQCGRLWGCSGTPMVGVPSDLWGVLVSLGLHTIYGSREEFVKLCGGRERWIFDKRQKRRRRAGYDWGQVSDVVREKLHTVMLRRKREGNLDLPPTQTIDIPVRAPEDIRHHLDEVTEKWDAIGPGDMPPFEMLSEAMTALARSKIDAAVEWATEHSLETPLLVFSAHRDPVLEIRERVPNAGAFVGETPKEERKALIQKFQRGELRVLAMTIDTGGAGITLSEAGAVLFVDRHYSPGMNDQAEMRANRPGQKHARVLVARMISNHPLDRRLSQILDEKSRLIRAAVG